MTKQLLFPRKEHLFPWKEFAVLLWFTNLIRQFIKKIMRQRIKTLLTFFILNISGKHCEEKNRKKRGGQVSIQNLILLFSYLSFYW